MLLEICSPAWIRSPVVLSLQLVPISHSCTNPHISNNSTSSCLNLGRMSWGAPFIPLFHLDGALQLVTDFKVHHCDGFPFSGAFQWLAGSLFPGFGTGEARRTFRKLRRAPFQLSHRPTQLVPGEGSAQPQPSLQNSSCP